MRFAGVRVHLHEKQVSADLIEVEIKRFASATVGSNDATHQTAFAHGNPSDSNFPTAGSAAGKPETSNKRIKQKWWLSSAKR